MTSSPYTLQPSVLFLVRLMLHLTFLSINLAKICCHYLYGIRTYVSEMGLRFKESSGLVRVTKDPE
ncbi:hypothetical protein JHL21_15950 [Devosia sp. WQ 349]|uniref:hypothetical protein n=1 Tax=Devosia sp. WQ 349K1 TaxID=2800329 RepID=UPI001903ABD6|nr:hypothetical protein [Devosia sp. WQ 349K1]MBK1795987.1 hypothetical protein [Devosia sp. WQ 349K1]